MSLSFCWALKLGSAAEKHHHVVLKAVQKLTDKQGQFNGPEDGPPEDQQTDIQKARKSPEDNSFKVVGAGSVLNGGTRETSPISASGPRASGNSLVRGAKKVSTPGASTLFDWRRSRDSAKGAEK